MAGFYFTMRWLRKKILPKDDGLNPFADLKNTYEKMKNENKEFVFLDKDEDTITIHLGKVLTEKQYDAVLHSVIDHLNRHWRHIL